MKFLHILFLTTLLVAGPALVTDASAQQPRNDPQAEQPAQTQAGQTTPATPAPEQAPAKPASEEPNAQPMPETASPMPLIALIGALSLGGGLVLRRLSH